MRLWNWLDEQEVGSIVLVEGVQYLVVVPPDSEEGGDCKLFVDLRNGEATELDCLGQLYSEIDYTPEELRDLTVRSGPVPGTTCRTCELLDTDTDECDECVGFSNFEPQVGLAEPVKSISLDEQVRVLAARVLRLEEIRPGVETAGPVRSEFKGTLEIDHARGVIYFHAEEGPLAGTSLLRISCLPPIPILDGLLDITHMHGVNWFAAERGSRV